VTVDQQEEVAVNRSGAIVTIRINRPEARNAMNVAVMAGIGFGLLHAESDEQVRAVVLTGTGDRAFCAGMDLRAFVEDDLTSGDDQKAGMEAFSVFIRGGFSTPVIGAANATAVAGGFELLMACDLIVASEDARFGIPEAKRGLFAAGGGVFLPRRIPLAIALELGMTGDMIDAGRASELGLVNRVVPRGDVLRTAVELAERIAANGPLGVQATRRLMRAAASMTDEELWALQSEIQPGVFASEDAKEGARAFVEKRAPVWTGR
jgi:enoyl-CoA hydratase